MAVEPSAGLSAGSPSAASVYLSEVEEMLQAWLILAGQLSRLESSITQLSQKTVSAVTRRELGGSVCRDAARRCTTTLTGRERAHHDRHADALLVLDSRSLSPQICGMSLPPAYLRQKLTQPLPTKSGAVLRTIGEAANYVLALPADRGELCQRWRHATKLILEQADAAAVSHQVHLALFYDAQLDIKAMVALGRVR